MSLKQKPWKGQRASMLGGTAMLPSSVPFVPSQTGKQPRRFVALRRMVYFDGAGYQTCLPGEIMLEALEPLAWEDKISLRKSRTIDERCILAEWNGKPRIVKVGHDVTEE